MKFSAIATILFGADVALAARFTEQRRERHAARAAERQSKPRQLPTNSEGVEYDGLTNSSHVEYSSNWAGAVLIGTGYKSVTGTFVVPTPSTPSGGSSRTEVSDACFVRLGPQCVEAGDANPTRNSTLPRLGWESTATRPRTLSSRQESTSTSKARRFPTTPGTSGTRTTRE